MKRIFIEEDRIQSLVCDLIDRVLASMQERPTAPLVVVGVGQSGLQIAEVLTQALDKRMPESSRREVIAFAVQSDRDAITSPSGILVEGGDTFDVGQYLRSGEIGAEAWFLILDGVTRTGKTMQRMYDTLKTEKYKNILCYSVALSSKTTFIPTWYGCMFDCNDQISLQRKGVTPNHCVFQRPKSKILIDSPPVVLRRPAKADAEFSVARPQSMNRYKSDDRYFDGITGSRQTFIIEWGGDPLGYISYVIKEQALWVDYVLIDDKYRDSHKGAGPALYQQIEMLAKINNCASINLWAFSEAINIYKKWGLLEFSGRTAEIGPSDNAEKYVLMTQHLFDETGHYQY